MCVCVCMCACVCVRGTCHQAEIAGYHKHKSVPVVSSSCPHRCFSAAVMAAASTATI